MGSLQLVFAGQAQTKDQAHASAEPKFD